jgi:hypothetical protein
MNARTISIDFDGVIHKYSKGWCDGSIYDDEVEGAFETMARLQMEGYRLVILTARDDENLPLVKEWFEKKRAKYMYLYDIVVNSVEITNKKTPAIAYIDDRGVRFTNWSDIKKYFC